MKTFNDLGPYAYGLGALAILGGVGLNGVFLWHVLLQPDLFAAAMRNPISAVFLVEAFVLTGFGSWVIHRMGYTRPGWIAFLFMSIAGSLAFSVPAFLLLHLRKTR